MEERIDRIQRFASIWWKSRAEGKKSQEYMALALGVSRKTVQNWERGISSPDLFESSEWFRTLGINPLNYYIRYLCPSYEDNIAKLEEETDVDKTREELKVFVDNMNAKEIADLMFLIEGNHGSSYYSLLELFTAYLHIPLTSRIMIAKVIFDQYEIADKTGNIVCTDRVRPDMDMLSTAIQTAKEAACQKKRQYTMQNTELGLIK